MDEITKLTGSVDRLYNSSRNRLINTFWRRDNQRAKDHWRGIPQSTNNISVIPFTVEPEPPMWASILDFSIKEYYTDPVCYLKNTLKMMVYRFENFNDFTPIVKMIPIWLGETFEPSLFGSKTIFIDNESPWIDREPVINDFKDFKSLEFPDFYSSGLMQIVHRMFNEMNELVGHEYDIVFQEWRMGPLGLACALRGMQNLLQDILLNPNFVKELMQFLTEARIKWVKEQAKFLNKKIGPCDLDNDEVNTPIISPEIYDEFILPFEQKICAFHGGIGYWHSCGDVSKLLPWIRKIPRIDLLHVGPWTDLQRVKELFGEDTPLEICLMPTTDVLMADEDSMKNRLLDIKNALQGAAFTIRADGMQVVHSVRTDVEKIQKWVDIAYDSLTLT